MSNKEENQKVNKIPISCLETLYSNLGGIPYI